MFAIYEPKMKLGQLQELFPNVSFPDTAPTQEWLDNNNAAFVNTSPEYDPDTQTAETAPYPYLQDKTVYLNIIRPLTDEEKQIKLDEKLQWVSKQAQIELSLTDWTELPSVSDTSKPVYLSNSQEFITYRNEIRLISVNPTIEPNWPTRPVAIWITK